MLLRFLYFIGLTNLSKEQVESFEKITFGYNINAPSFFLFFLLIFFPLSLLAKKIELLKAEIYFLIVLGYFILPLFDAFLFFNNKKAIKINKRKIFSYIPTLIILSGALLSIIQFIILPEYKEKTIQYYHFMSNAYNLLINSKQKIDEVKLEKILRIKSDELKAIKTTSDKTTRDSSQEFDYNKKSGNRRKEDEHKNKLETNESKINNLPNKQVKQQDSYDSKSISVSLMSKNFDFDIATLFYDIKNQIIKRNKNYSFLLSRNEPVKTLFQILYKDGPVKVPIQGFSEIQKFYSKSVVIGSNGFHSLVNQEKSIFISSPDLFFFSKWWVTRRIGDIIIKVIHVQDTNRYGILIHKILHDQLCSFFDLRENDIILQIEDYIFLSPAIDYMSIYNYIFQKDLHDVRLVIARNNKIIYKYFIQRD